MLNVEKNEIINGFIQWHHQLYQGNYHFYNAFNYDLTYFNILFLEYPNIKQQIHILDYILLPGLLITSQTVPLVFLQFIPRHEDPFSFILDDMLRNYPIHRDGGILVQLLILPIRVTFLLAYTEVLRLWMLVITSVVILISNVTNCLKLLNSDKLSCENLLRHYKVCYLLYTISADVLMKVATLIITTIFCICVIEVVVLVKAHPTMETTMYLSICGSVIVILGGFYIILKQLSIVAESTEELVAKLQNNATENYAQAKTPSQRKIWRAVKMECNAVKRLQIGFFGDMSVDRAFMVSVLDNMAERAADLLILS